MPASDEFIEEHIRADVTTLVRRLAPMSEAGMVEGSEHLHSMINQAGALTADDACSFWAVSDWLALRLLEKGERVDSFFAGLRVWARTSPNTGDDPALDAIYAERTRTIPPYLTSDIGFAIRDAMEGMGAVRHEHDDENGYAPTLDVLEVVTVDISNIDNPIVHLENGQSFTIHIIAG